MSKKSIIAIITIIVLLFAAGLSIGVFLYGKGETQATDENQTTDQNQVADGNQTIDGNQTGDDTDNTVAPDNSDENVTTPDNEGDENVANNQGNAGNDDEVTTDANVNNVGETTISRVEEQERLISEDFLDWWKPMEVSVKQTEVGVELPQISVKKVAITGTGDANLVYIGQDITYVIAVTNNSETAVENIEVTDKIPENTTYVADSIKDAVILKDVDGELTSEVVGTKTTVEVENKVIGVKWVVSIPAGETVITEFTVNVNKTMLDVNNESLETIGTVYNKAIANGEESNEVQTSIIKTHKSSVVTRDGNIVESKTAKIGDLITYTISVENTGDIEGTTYIADEVPAGTTFVSAQEGAIISEAKDSMVWSVTIPAHTTITREFTVKVTSIDGIIKNVADVGGKPTNEDLIDTANIDVIKTATTVNGEAITEDNPLEPVKVGDKIEYTIVVTNTGSRDLTNVLLEEQLDGVEVTKLVVDGVEKTVEKDAETGKLIIGNLNAVKEAEAVEGSIATITATYIVSDKDIINKGNEDGTQMPIYNKVYVTGKIVEGPENPEEVPEEVEDKDDEIVPVAPDPRFTVEKRAVDVSGKVRPGDIVKYEIVVTNIGNTTLTNIEVRDSLNIRVAENYNDKYDENQKVIKAGDIIKVIPSLVSGAHESIITYYEVNQGDMTIDENQIEIIKNIVTAKPEELDQKQDDEIVHVNPNITLSGTKTWYAPSTVTIEPITVTVYQNGSDVPYKANVNGNETEFKLVLTPGKAGYSFGPLPKYSVTEKADGTIEWIKNSYEVREDNPPEGFQAPVYSQIIENGNNWVQNITNKWAQEYLTIAVNKNWHDLGTEEAVRARPTIYIDLYKKVGNGPEIKVNEKTLTFNNDKTSDRFEGLEKYTITTNQDGTLTYTLNSYRVAERFDSNKYTSSGPSVTTPITSSETVEFTNTVNQDKTSIKAKKEWNILSTVTGATKIKIYLYKNDKKTNQYVELEYDGTKTQTHTFKNLEKYKTNSDGTIYINSDGKAELNIYTVHEEVKPNSQYIVKEEIKTNETVITNTPKGIVEQVEIKPIDVVFVLDVSNSMNSDGKDAAMVNAINSTLEKIKEINSNSKVGIVAYNTKVTNITDGLTNIKKIGTFTNGTGDNKDYIYYKYKDGGEEKTTSINVKNSTYTAAGIEAGAAMLSGDTVIKERIPILILLSDGVPTYYKDEEGNRVSDVMEDYGRGGKTSPENVYYTIKTAWRCKQEIDKTYEEKVNFYTIGLGINENDKAAMNACLNPTAKNVKAYSVEDTDKYKLEEGSYYNLKKYYDDDKKSYGSLDYSDATYVNSGVDGDDLKENLAAFISATTQRLIKESEIGDKKVVVNGVDTTREFKITFGNQEYTPENAPTGVLEIDGTTYTVHLDVLGVTTEGNTNQVYIKYYKIKQ